MSVYRSSTSTRSKGVTRTTSPSLRNCGSDCSSFQFLTPKVELETFPRNGAQPQRPRRRPGKSHGNSPHSLHLFQTVNNSGVWHRPSPDVQLCVCVCICVCLGMTQMGTGDTLWPVISHRSPPSGSASFVPCSPHLHGFSFRNHPSQGHRPSLGSGETQTDHGPAPSSWGPSRAEIPHMLGWLDAPSR